MCVHPNVVYRLEHWRILSKHPSLQHTVEGLSKSLKSQRQPMSESEIKKLKFKEETAAAAMAAIAAAKIGQHKSFEAQGQGRRANPYRT
ncbi:hypothetical protein LINGRAHAP2_LOCUS32146 [Linum grandiflorum]